jgi:hypothetical protein
MHKSFSQNCKQQKEDSLLIDGTISTSRLEINEHIVQLYRNLYTEQFSWRPFLDGLSFDSTDRLRLVS